MLQGKVALITGASRGIGDAICKRFSDSGAIVYAAMRFPKCLTEYNIGKGMVIPIRLDVCDIDSIKQCILEIKNRQGFLDILVNNAGITNIERLAAVSSCLMENMSLQGIPF